MGSRISNRQKRPPLNLVTLPASCVPAKETNSLAVKRAAQLKWMREKGVRYLGDPQKRFEARSPSSDRRPARVVGIRSEPESELERRDAANEA